MSDTTSTAEHQAEMERIREAMSRLVELNRTMRHDLVAFIWLVQGWAEIVGEDPKMAETIIALSDTSVNTMMQRLRAKAQEALQKLHESKANATEIEQEFQ